MSDVKSRRKIAAEATQQVIVETAAKLFVKQGYAVTTITQIARESGVAVQTIYNSIGSKRELLSRVLDFAAAGDRAPRPVPAFMQEQSEAEPDPRRVLALLVEFWQGGLERTTPIFEVIRQAAALDPEIAQLETERAQQRLRNYGMAGRLLAERGDLREGLTPDDAAAVIFALGHPESYRLLVHRSGWSSERWAQWVTDALCAALLPADSLGSSPASVRGR
jgi:AcrR family transcriptional regulator